MIRERRQTRVVPQCAVVLTAASIISLIGCDIQRPLRSPAATQSSQQQPAAAAVYEVHEPQNAEPDEVTGPLLIPAQRRTTSARATIAEIRPAMVVSERVYRLPPPPLALLELPGATLLDQLAPIAEEELAGEPGPLEPTSDSVAELSGPHMKPSDETTVVEKSDEPATTAPAKPGRAFTVGEFDEDAQLASETSIDDVLAYFPAEDELSARFQPRVREAFTLARHGALHAAKGRFEELLSELARAKDASQMTDRHARALAAGLRALREADDFTSTNNNPPEPQAIAAGHLTPMLHEGSHEWTLPHEAIAMYHLYAQQKMAAAVSGEQAGSMMLFGLGKINAQLAERDHMPQAIRKSLTMYRSAVAAHQMNYLAANEAGVLLARSGRYRQSLPLLNIAAQIGGSSATHRNLAHVHSKLGNTQLATQHQHVAVQVARREMVRGQLSTERGIAWVSPEEFNRRSHAAGATSLAKRSPAASVPQPRLETPPRVAGQSGVNRTAQQSTAGSRLRQADATGSSAVQQAWW